MHMQDKAKGVQAKCAELVEGLHKKLPALFPQRSAIQKKVNAMEVRANRVIKRNYLCCES